MPRKRTLFLGAIVLLLIGGALAAWLARDWPRRKVEWALEEELDADVWVGDLRILGTREFVLERLTVRSMRSMPLLQELRIGSLTVTGSPGEILEGRIEALEVQGGEIRLAPSDRLPVTEEEEEPLPVIGKLTLSDFKATIDATDLETEFDLSGTVRQIGAEPSGRIDITARELLPAPLIALAAGDDTYRSFRDKAGFDPEQPVHGFEGVLEIGGEGTIARLAAGTEGTIDLIEGGSLPFPGIEVELSTENVLQIALESESVLSLAASVTADLEPLGIDLTIDDPAKLLLALGLLPAGAEVEGNVAGNGAADEDGYFRWDLASSFGRISVPLQGETHNALYLSIDLEGVLESITPDIETSLRGKLVLPSLEAGRTAPASVLDRLLPSTLEIDGEYETDTFTGTMKLVAADLGTFTSEGFFTLTAENSYIQQQWSWDGPDVATALELATSMEIDLPDLKASSSPLTASGTLRGDLADPEFDMELHLDGLALDLEQVSLSGGELAAKISPSSLESIDLESLELSGNLQIPELDPRELRIRAGARYKPDEGSLAFHLTDLSLFDVGRLEVDVLFFPRLENRWNADLRLTELDLPATLDYLEPVTGEILPGFSPEGSPAADLKVTFTPEGTWSATGNAHITGTRLSSDDGSKVVEGLDTDWKIAGTGNGTEGPFLLEAETEAKGFLLLWGLVFADYSEVAPTIRLRAEGGTEWNATAKVELDGVALDAGLEIAPDRPPIGTLELKIEDLAGPFERYVRGPLADSVEELQKFRAAGSVAVRLDVITNEENFALDGAVTLRGLDLEGVKGGVFVRGLDLDLPVDLNRPGGGELRSGKIRFERMALGDVGFDETATGLVVLEDTVGLEGALTVPLLGGRLELHELTLVDLLHDDRHVLTGLGLHGLDLGDLSAALDIVPLEGKMEGSFPRVELTAENLVIDGGGTVELFGGTVTVGDISGQNVLSRFPRFTFSADFRDIDLSSVTRTFDFGEMNGILEGSIRDCELFGGVPVKLEGELRTVQRKGIPQSINVKAINNLAILGTGGRVGVFDRGIHKFLDRYTYEALGVTMKLDNDVFLLRGTERRGEKELFLKGRLPFRIDIVNVKPGQTVSFRAMVDRVGSLDFSTATTGP